MPINVQTFLGQLTLSLGEGKNLVKMIREILRNKDGPLLMRTFGYQIAASSATGKLGSVFVCVCICFDTQGAEPLMCSHLINNKLKCTHKHTILTSVIQQVEEGFKFRTIIPTKASFTYTYIYMLCNIHASLV